MKIEDDPLLPQCFKDNPSPDRKAMEWVTEQIRKLPRGWWQKAAYKYNEEHDKPVDKPEHQRDNEQRRNANLWLLGIVTKYANSGGSSTTPGMRNKPHN